MTNRNEIDGLLWRQGTKKAVAQRLVCATAFWCVGDDVGNVVTLSIGIISDLLDQIIDRREIAARGEAELAVRDFGGRLADLHAEGVDGVHAEGVDCRIQFEISGDNLRFDGTVAFVVLDGVVVVIDGARVVGMADDGQQDVFRFRDRIVRQGA